MLAAIVDSSDDAIIGKTLEGIVVSWNAGAERTYGYSAAEMIGKPISILLPPGRPDEIIQILEKVKRGEPVARYNTIRLRRDGRVINVSLTVSPIRDNSGSLIGASTISRDITEQKNKDEKLLELSQAVEQSGSIVVITDTSGNIEYVNPKFCDVTGYSPAEAMGKNPKILKSGDTPAEEYKILWDTIKAGKEWRGEFHNKKKDGSLYWESAVISPVKDDSGNIARFMAVKEDVTESKRLQDELRKKVSALENFNKVAVGRELKMIELKKKIKELEEKLRNGPAGTET
jgi:sigma-B regulation protein RsbU (phosphoserine phosphatase)